PLSRSRKPSESTRSARRDDKPAKGYRKALDSWLGESGCWYPNWPLGEAHSIGELGRLHGPVYPYEGSSQLTFQADPPQTIWDAWIYHSANDTSVTIGTTADTDALSFLGSAGAGIQASFGSSGAVYLSAAGIHIRRIAEVAALRED